MASLTSPPPETAVFEERFECFRFRHLGRECIIVGTIPETSALQEVGPRETRRALSSLVRTYAGGREERDWVLQLGGASDPAFFSKNP